MKKLTFEEKQLRLKQKRQARLDAKPVLGMAHYRMGDLAVVKLQIIGLSKHGVTMKTISGSGTIKLTTNNGRPIEEIIKIEMLPCSIVPTLTTNGKSREIPQGTECGL